MEFRTRNADATDPIALVVAVIRWRVAYDCSDLVMLQAEEFVELMSFAFRPPLVP